jgi:hypothetical protein
MTHGSPFRVRPCSRPHFDAYFRLAPGGFTLPGGAVRDLRSRVADAAHIGAERAKAAEVRLADGRRRSALVLEELRLMVPELDAAEAAGLCLGLAEASGSLEGEEDEGPFFGLVSDFLLLRFAVAACIGRLPEGEARGELAEQAMRRGSCLWQSELADDFSSYWREGAGRRDDEPPLDEATARRLDVMALEAIRAAARNGDLVAPPRLVRLLFRWARLAGDGGQQVRAWTSARLDEDGALPALAAASVGPVWSQGISLAGGLGDHVAQRSWRLHQGMSEVLDVDRLVGRSRDLLSSGAVEGPGREALQRLVDAHVRASREG